MHDLPHAFARALAGKIRDARVSRGWTREDLAHRTNGTVGSNALASYETGRRTMPVGDAWELARALDLNLAALIRSAEQHVDGHTETSALP